MCGVCGPAGKFIEVYLFRPEVVFHSCSLIVFNFSYNLNHGPQLNTGMAVDKENVMTRSMESHNHNHISRSRSLDSIAS